MFDVKNSIAQTISEKNDLEFDQFNPNKTGLFEGSFFWEGSSI